jgi:hypothetical protein
VGGLETVPTIPLRFAGTTRSLGPTDRHERQPETTKLLGVDPLQLQTGFLIHPTATARGDPIMITQEYSTCSKFNSCGMNEYGFHIILHTSDRTIASSFVDR